MGQLLKSKTFGPQKCAPKIGFNAGLRISPTLVEDLLDVVGGPYDGVDYVVVNDVHETMLGPRKSDHPSPP
jgi:hypothetical protein